MGGVSVGGGSVEGECGRRVWKESVGGLIVWIV